MDPASILAIVGGVCMVVKGCIETYEVWSSYREHKAAVALGIGTRKEEEKLSQELESSPSMVQNQYNQLVTSLGGRFTRSSDKTLQKDFKKILGKQRYLIKYLEDLRNQSSTFQGNEKVYQSIREYANGIQADLSKAMLGFAQRSTPTRLLDNIFDKVNDQETELEPSNWPRKFCYGALLLQSDDYLDGAVLACDPTLFSLAFTCKYCSLEVGDYRMRSSGKTAISTRLLAASHVVSCPSFMDRRAAYKCLPCHAKHFDIDFPSAIALERHLKKHPNSRQLRDSGEKDIVDELHIDVEELGLQPDEDDVVNSVSLLQPKDERTSSTYGQSAAPPRPLKPSFQADTVSLESEEGTLEPNSASKASWHAGPLDHRYHPDIISELDTNDRYNPPQLPTTQAQTPEGPQSSRQPQTAAPTDHYHTPNQQPSTPFPSRHHTPNPHQPTPPQSSPADSFIYQQHQEQQPAPLSHQPHQSQHYQQAPPIPGRIAPTQQPYQNSQPASRISSESTQYERAMSMGQRPVPTMNDISQGYHPKQPSRRPIPDIEEKKESSFFKRNKKK